MVYESAWENIIGTQSSFLGFEEDYSKEADEIAAFEDLWGTQLTFSASGKKNRQFIREIESIKLNLTVMAAANDRRGEPAWEYYTFVKGKLDY